MVLNEIGIRFEPLELTFPIGTQVIFTISVRTVNKVQDLSKEKEALTFAERIKMFSGGKDNMKKNRAIKYKTTLRDSTNPLTTNKAKYQTINIKDNNFEENKNNIKNIIQNEQNNNEIIKDNNIVVNEMNENKEKKEKIYDSSEVSQQINNISKEENHMIPQEINSKEDSSINETIQDSNNKKKYIQVENKYSQEIHVDKIESNEISFNANEAKNYIQEQNKPLNSNETKNMIQVENYYTQESHVDKEDNNEISLSPIEKKEDNLQTSQLVNKDISKPENELNDEFKLKFKPSKTLMEQNENINNIRQNANIDILKKEERNLSFYKKLSVPMVPAQYLNQFDDEEFEDEKEFVLEGITYDKYLSKLKFENKKEHESGRESFCEGFFIASFPKKEGQVIENSQSFPSSCGHEECSMLPAMKPEIICRYPLEDTKTLELNNLAATICFPTGIKVCYNEERPSMITDYVTPITNQKGERYYMVTFHFYHKIISDVYSKIYEMHPLKHHLMKFADSYLNMSDKEIDKKVTKKIEEDLAKSQELGFRDYVYVPYCICLISKYRYIPEMKKCLESIYTMIINNSDEKGPDLNNLIMYLIHSVPIPENNTKVKFFIPYAPKGIELKCPKVKDISIMNTNMSNLLHCFSIDNLIIIFRLMLFEKKILFIDDDYTRLSLVTDSLISLLYPFPWVHTYIPIMSDQMIKYLETFLPFLNGINSTLMPLVKEIFMNNEVEDSEEVFLIYINLDKFRLGSSLISNSKKKYKYLQENVPALPALMEKSLKLKLKKIKEELEKPKRKKINLNEIDLEIRNAFINMFVEMFHDYNKYMTFLDDDVIFNKKLFLEKIVSNNDKHFYDEFIETQLFQQFTQNIIKDELKYFSEKTKNYSNKIGALKRVSRFNFNKEKLYIIKPDYLQINEKKSNEIEKKMKDIYTIIEKGEEDTLSKSSKKILSNINLIKNEFYEDKNCYIYTLPETNLKMNPRKEKYESSKLVTRNDKVFNIFKNWSVKAIKTFGVRGDELSEKEKDSIKETIKDFTIKIFKSEEIEGDINQKKDLQNALNSNFGRECFVNLLTKNVNNIILLKEKSFHLLGVLIYNSLLFVLNIEETDTIIGQMAKLVKSTKFFGNEKKGETTTLWDVYKSRIQGYSKVSQANFWNKWYDNEITEELNYFQKEKIILEICDIMIQLELNKSFIKNVIVGISEKEFGKDSEESKSIFNLITEKIIGTKYISKANYTKKLKKK